MHTSTAIGRGPRPLVSTLAVTVVTGNRSRHAADRKEGRTSAMAPIEEEGCPPYYRKEVSLNLRVVDSRLGL